MSSGTQKLVPLIYKYLQQHGYGRAAKELQAQSGQKAFPAQTASLQDIYTYWAKAPENMKRKTNEADGGSPPKKMRVADPESSMESSEEENEASKKPAPGGKAPTGNSVHSMSAARAKSSEEDSSEEESSEEEKDVKAKGQAKGTVTPGKPVSGKLAHGSPVTLTLPLNKSTPGKVSTLALSQAGQATPSQAKKVPVKTTTPAKTGGIVKKVETSESESSESESEEEKEKQPAKGMTKPVAKVAAEKPESSSEESSDESDSEEEEGKKNIQSKSAGKAPQASLGPNKSTPAAAVSTKGAQGKASTPAPAKSAPVTPSQAKMPLGKTTTPAKAAVTGKKAESSDNESSDSSESDEEKRTLTQSKPAGKVPLASLGPNRSTPATPVFTKGTQGKASTPAPAKSVPVTPSQGKTTTPAKAAVTGKKAESSDSESSDSSESEEVEMKLTQSKPAGKAPQASLGPNKNTPATPDSTKGAQGKASTPASAKSVPVTPSQAKLGQGKYTTPAKATVTGKKAESSDSESSDSSESEEEMPQTQKTKPPLTPATAKPGQSKAATPASATGTKAVRSESDGSDSSESEEEMTVALKPVIKQTPKLAPKNGIAAQIKKATPTVISKSQASKNSSEDSSEESNSEDEEKPAQKPAPAQKGAVSLTAKSTKQKAATPGKAGVPTPNKQAKVLASAKTDSSESDSSDDEDVESPQVSTKQPTPSGKVIQANSTLTKNKPLKSTSKGKNATQVLDRAGLATPTHARSGLGTVQKPLASSAPKQPEVVSESSSEESSEEEENSQSLLRNLPAAGKSPAAIKSTPVKTPQPKSAQKMNASYAVSRPQLAKHASPNLTKGISPAKSARLGKDVESSESESSEDEIEKWKAPAATPQKPESDSSSEADTPSVPPAKQKKKTSLGKLGAERKTAASQGTPKGKAKAKSKASPKSSAGGNLVPTPQNGDVRKGTVGTVTSAHRLLSLPVSGLSESSSSGSDDETTTDAKLKAMIRTTMSKTMSSESSSSDGEEKKRKLPTAETKQKHAIAVKTPKHKKGKKVKSSKKLKLSSGDASFTALKLKDQKLKSSEKKKKKLKDKKKTKMSVKQPAGIKLDTAQLSDTTLFLKPKKKKKKLTES